jgi:hypothetical protein
VSFVREFCVTAWGTITRSTVWRCSQTLLAASMSLAISGAVVRRDPVRLVAEQILPILRAHAGSPNAVAERVLEIVNVDSRRGVRPRKNRGSGDLFERFPRGKPD